MVELAVSISCGQDRREFKLVAGGPPLIVGRGSDAALRIENPLLSRKHFELRYDPERGVEVTDLQSANGTFVNGMVARKAALRPGDVVRAGNVAFKIEFSGAAPPRERPT